MATADEILATMAEEAAATDQMAEVCTIDRCTRAVTIPEALRIVGVETDKDVTRRVFRVLCSYRGTNLSTFRIRIHFMNANKEKDIYYVTDAAQDGEYLTFSWVISRNATKYKGKLQFIVCMVCDGGTDEEREWNSTLGEFTVLEGLEVELTDGEEEQARDAITQLLAVIDARESEAVEAVSAQGTTQVAAVRAAGAQQEASIAAKGAATLETIPDDYATLHNNVAALSEDIKQSGLSNEIDFSASIAGECIYFNGALLQDQPIFSRVEFDIKAGSTIIANVAQSALNTAVFAQKIGSGYTPLVISDSPYVAEYKYTVNDDMTICLTYRNDKEYNALVRIEPKQLAEETNDNKATLMQYSRTGEMPITADFVRGKVNTYGFYWDVTNRIRSAHVIKIINNTTIKARDGFRFAVVSFADGAIAKDSGWQTEYTIPAGSEVVLNIARSNEDEAEIADVEYFSAQVYIASTKILELEKRIGKAWPEIPSLCRFVCHRGYTTIADPETGAPENTLSAIRLAYENGFRYVEIDVAETLDGEIVLMHDDSINRTCLNADGSEIVNVVNVSETNYSDLLKYTANRQAPAFGDKIPTLKQALTLAKKLGLQLYIELKNGNTSSGVATIVDNVKKMGMTRHVSYVSFFWEKLGIVSDITTDSRLGFLTNGYDIDDNILVPVRTHATSKGAEAFINFGVSFDGLTDESSALTEKGMQNAMEADVELEVYVLNTGSLVDKYLGTYITGILTDGYNPFK